LTLSIAAGTFYVTASFADCNELFCFPSDDGPVITCIIGSVWAFENGLETECEPRDDSCEIEGYTLVQMTEGMCAFKGGTPATEM
jgi:hypothetical protein